MDTVTLDLTGVILLLIPLLFYAIMILLAYTKRIGIFEIAGAGSLLALAVNINSHENIVLLVIFGGLVIYHLWHGLLGYRS